LSLCRNVLSDLCDIHLLGCLMKTPKT